MSQFIESYILYAFVSFAENKTLTKTAEELHISQPSLSLAMQKLEEQMCVKLFDRNKNKISLNENGLFALEYAKKIMALQDEMIEKTRFFDEKNKSLRFGSIAYAPEKELLPKLNQYFMGTKIISRISDSELELLEQLEDGSFDFVILRNKKDGYFCSELFTEHLYALLHKTHRFAAKKTVTLNELSGEKFLIMKNIGFWEEIVKSKISDADFFWQENFDHLQDLINFSTIPSFITNITRDSKNFNTVETKERIAVPVSDKEVNVTFYFVCKKENAKRFEGIITV